MHSVAVDGFELIPDPGKDWSPTKAQVRGQRDGEELRARAARLAAEAPPLSEEILQTLAVLLPRKTLPSDLVEWWLRLFCGHQGPGAKQRSRRDEDRSGARSSATSAR